MRALVDRARIQFGIGETEAARRDADRAAARASSDAQLRSLLGFIKLAAGADAAARARLRRSGWRRTRHSANRTSGSGCSISAAAVMTTGCSKCSTATLLEPKVSLYPELPGKGVLPAARFPEGLAALASAKRLDPRDPTPWLYASFFLRDLNRQVDALDELRHAIALNDNRAVYRSRLLLDRDLATKNVSLAKLYNQLGFERGARMKRSTR